MGDKSIKKREVKKKKKVVETNSSSVEIKSVVTQSQPEIITKPKKDR